MAMTISIRPLREEFVAEVSGVDISRPLDAGAVRTIDDAINRYAVLVFHGQSLDDTQLLEFGRTFGTIAPPRNHRAGHRLQHAEIADISNLNVKNELRARDDHRRLDSLGNQLWHSDASFRPISGALSMLHAHVVPPKGGDTMFADLRAAYDELDAETKELIGNLVAEHSIFNSRGQLGHTDYTDAERAALPAVRHPLVRVHPGSKRKTLYMGSHASHIIGWPMPEGRLLLRELTEHATQQRFVHTHKWKVGDLVIWDNRCTLHRGARYDDARYRRDLRRVTTQDLDSAGDNPELVAAG
jgi:alpha-ketoglutarate-dependent 2,4-dichlorophenoxyacetate dioxygenase